MELIIQNEGIVWKNPYPSVRSVYVYHGHTVNLGEGELLHALRMGQARSSLDSRCVLLRSRDYGKTWDEPVSLIDGGGRDPRFSYHTARLSLTRDGTLWAASLRFHQVEPEDSRWTRDNGGWLNADNFLCRSTDRGKTWSKPRYVGPEPPMGGFPTVAGPVYELDSGELMLVFEAYFNQSLEALHHRVTALYSHDEGQTWTDQSVIAEDPTGQLAYFDPRLCRLNDGRWVCLFWTHDKRSDEARNTTVAYSRDGRHWTVPQSTELWGFPTLPLALPDGRLFAVYNYRRIPQGVRCALSEDGGTTWDLEHEYVLWDQETRRISGELATKGRERSWEGSCLAEMFTWDFGVPDPTLLDDGSILVTFYATQWDHVTHQRFVRLRIS